MENNIENPPAFPLFIPESEYPKEYNAQGMDLRDYFAAKAMHGMVVSSWSSAVGDSYYRLAKTAYEIADAMLKARQHGK